MEYGNANYENVKGGLRSPPIARGALWALAWLLPLSQLYFLGTSTMLLLMAIALVHPLYYLGRTVQGTVDFVKTDAQGVQVTMRYCPTISAAEVRITRHIPWNTLRIFRGEESNDGESSVYRAKLMPDEAFPEFGGEPIPLSKQFNTQEAAQECVDQWNACKAGR